MRQRSLRRKAQIASWFLLCLVGFGIVPGIIFLYAPASENYVITEQYLFATIEDDVLIYLGVLLPREGPYQSVEAPTVSWDGQIRLDENQYTNALKLTGSLEDEQSQQATIEYRVTLYQGVSRWSSQVEPFQTRPQPNIESDDPEILERASQIAGGNSYQDAYEIYRFTADYLEPSQTLRRFVDTSALIAYHTKEGACGEYANLMVALCRAAGIPSQTIVGILLPDIPPFAKADIRSLSYPGDSHAWVEFYADGRWETADPTGDPSMLKRTLFGRTIGRHLSYGETGSLGDAYQQLRIWAIGKGELIGERYSSIKFVAAANAEDVTITPRVSLRKGWDGRWANMLASWMVIMFILWRLNLRQVNRFYAAGHLCTPSVALARV